MSQEDIVYQLTERLESLLEQNQTEELTKLCAEQHPADLTEALDLLDTEEKQFIFRLLDLPMAAEVLGECDEDHQVELMAALDEETLARVMEFLPPDEAADAVSELSDAQALRVLSKISAEESEEIRDLLKYHEDTAGGIMTPDVVAFPETMTIRELLDAFRGIRKKDPLSTSALQSDNDELEDAYEFIREENVYRVYVIDEDRKLKGFVRLQDLILSDPDCRLSEVLKTDLISVKTNEDQEKVAEMAHKYDLVSIPVTDAQGHLVGRVTIDDVIDVIEDEVTEDMMKMAGTTEDELVTWSSFRSLFLRLPWLLVALAGLLLTSRILRVHESTFVQTIKLTFYITVVCGISGNTAVQSATIVVRGLATGQIDMKEYLPLIWKEIRTGFMVGFICGAIVGSIAYLDTGVIRMGGVIGISILAAISMASLWGVLIPTFLARIGKDPAIATGPLITSLCDAMSVTIYLGIASILI